MYLIRFGRWNQTAGRWLFWERLWRRGYKWTPLCKVGWRRGRRG